MKGFFTGIETALLGMVLLRVISGLIELSAAGLMLKFNSIEKAVAINAILAIVGPLVLITTMTIGLIGLADKLSASKLILIGLGVTLILIGIKR
ncbi:MAG: YqhV family protein [Bacillaceae bacterium]|uniref:YqhV family protein n=1 Tax=Alkalihalobacterium chitinilyticum TaxID=2980103 RepID=A0ABT5VCQ2_9BACI|nr:MULTISPECIES: YqhV family protein [Alkalihalobacterium]MDE5412258.1 YqhV family protein [Alkalihalobacterium chitinilyticum]MEB1806555.1 YqhV family protein [Bacillaceae bacterium]